MTADTSLAKPPEGIVLTIDPAQAIHQALHVLAPPGTARVILAVRYREVHDGDRTADPASPDSSTGLGATETADHIRRLQNHGLLTATTPGPSDALDHQATTQLARDLGPVWAGAFTWAHRHRPPLPPCRLADPIEDVLRLLDHPLTTALLPQLRPAPAARAGLAQALTPAGLAELDGHLHRLHEAHLVTTRPRHNNGTVIQLTNAGRDLSRVQDALSTWWHHYTLATPSRTPVASASLLRPAHGRTTPMPEPAPDSPFHPADSPTVQRR